MRGNSQSETVPRHGGRLDRLDTWVLALLILGTVGYIAYGQLAAVDDLIFRLSDDAFYYFKVAQNIVSGAGPTFDGINPTNGFHPLWMLVILPVFSIASSDPVTALRAALVLIAIVAGSSLWMAYRMMSAYGSRLAAAAVGGLFLSPFLLNPLLNGLESGLLLFFSFLTLWALNRFDLTSTRLGYRQDMILGLLLAAVFLARLDSAFMILGILGLIVARWLKEDGQPRSWSNLVKKFVIVGAVAAVFVLPYFAWNLANTGHIVPISGALKSTFPVISFNPRRLLGYHALFGLGQILFTLVLLIIRLASNKGNPERPDQRAASMAGSTDGILIALWLGNALHFTNAMLFMNWGAHWWHYASYLPLTLAAMARVGDQFLAPAVWSRRWAVAVGLMLMLLSVVALGLDASRRGDQHHQWYMAAIWTSANLPDTAAVAMTDCGLFGYFSNRRTINLDGVINSYEYQRAIRDGRLDAFLQRCGVTHIAAHDSRYKDGIVRIWLPARYYSGAAANILVAPEAEVYRSETHKDVRGIPVRFLIWDERKVDIRETGEPL